MSNITKIISGTIIIVILILSGLTVEWAIDKDYTKVKRDNNVIAKFRWYVEAERSSFLLDSWYDRNIKCPKIIDLGGHISSTNKSCMYPDDYYESLSRSLINTKVYDNENNIIKRIPYYKYGTRGTYAGFLNEFFLFNENISSELNFPEKYNIEWLPKDKRNYKMILKIWDLKDIKVIDDCHITALNIEIDLKNECEKLDILEVDDDIIKFYFKSERELQCKTISIIDPSEKPSIIYGVKNITIKKYKEVEKIKQIPIYKEVIVEIECNNENETCSICKDEKLGKFCTFIIRKIIDYYDEETIMINESYFEQKKVIDYDNVIGINNKNIDYFCSYCNLHNNKLVEWSVPIGDRNKELFPGCDADELRIGVCKEEMLI